MRIRSFFLPFAVCLVAGSISAQSLSELAKKEKERRKKNKEKGEQVLVITEAELQQGKSESEAPVESSAEPTPAPPTSSRAPSSARSDSTLPPRSPNDEVGERSAPTEIPRDMSLRDRIAIFEQMLTAYRQQVQEIDAEIAKNNTRIEEIQRQLSTIGAGGLPVAPKVDRNPRYPGEATGLQAEQNELRRRNQELEVSKKRLASELRDKGRRAGIPAGYLRF